jgi:hypothetical protein
MMMPSAMDAITFISMAPSLQQHALLYGIHLANIVGNPTQHKNHIFLFCTMMLPCCVAGL